MSPINLDFLISFQIDIVSTFLTDASWEIISTLLFTQICFEMFTTISRHTVS